MESVNKNIHIRSFDNMENNMEKYDTFCDRAAPSSLPVLEDTPVLKTEVNEVPSTCQSLHSVLQTINQETHQDNNSSSLQQPTVSSSPQTRNHSCLNESRPSTGSIPRQGSIDSGYLNPTVAYLHKARGVSLVIVLLHFKPAIKYLIVNLDRTSA